ncbi:hypothetical protein C1910_12150 [Listeria ivanovii]|uniref:hypothetical protein n=1 Tax=Listeria ivanovii TaxID=1638 RepID=UPI00065E336D|nr:hypothetical protein [Listeria ivanovii]PZG37253.1 hypothetical protein C1910_12150 [Listeria ivanovii]
MKKKIWLILSLMAILLSAGGFKSVAYNYGWKDVFYWNSPYDFTYPQKKYTKSAYGMYTSKISGAGTASVWPRANKQAVIAAASDYKVVAGKSIRIANYAVEYFGRGCTTDIAARSRQMPWDGRLEISGNWQPDI